MGWNLLGPLVQILLKKEDRNLPHCHAILSHLLEVICILILNCDEICGYDQHAVSMLFAFIQCCFVNQVGSPKELLVGLLEQVEEADSASIAETVTLLLKPLQTGFSSLTHKH